MIFPDGPTTFIWAMLSCIVPGEGDCESREDEKCNVQYGKKVVEMAATIQIDKLNCSPVV